MSVARYLKKHVLVVFAALAYGCTALVAAPQLVPALRTSGKYLLEMIFVLPVVFMLTVLIEVWISRDSILRHLGAGSGIKGAALSIALGSLSAGPIYAAFPLCRILLAKGLSVTNLVIVLSAWAVIKVPMLAMEARFLGPGFMAVRWLLTVAAILGMGALVGALVKRDDIPVEAETGPERDEPRIDQSICTACALCVRSAPHRFFKDGSRVTVRPAEAAKGQPAEDRASLARLCPFGAIQ